MSVFSLCGESSVCPRVRGRCLCVGRVCGSRIVCLGCTTAAWRSFVWFSAFIEQANGASRTRYSMNCSGWHFSGRKWGGQSERGNRLTDEFYLHSVHQSINVWARDKTWLISTGCFGIPDTKERLVTVWVVTLPTESDLRVHFYSIND